MNFAKFPITPFLTEHLRWLLLFYPNNHYYQEYQQGLRCFPFYFIKYTDLQVSIAVLIAVLIYILLTC